MSFQHSTCGHCLHTQEFYGRFIPPCPKCGSVRGKPMTAEEYYKAMGCGPKEVK